MNLHEYQAKDLFRKWGLPVPPSGVASTPEEAELVCRRLSGEKFVVKAQIHAGARGKAGGVRLVSGSSKVREVAGEMLGQRLRTAQTGAAGQPVNQVLVQVKTEIAKEFYVGVLLDRAEEKPCLIFSSAGGVDIEEVAKKSPEQIWKQMFSPRTGLSKGEVKEFFIRRGGVSPPEGMTHGPQGRGDLAPTLFRPHEIDALAPILVNLTRLFLETDASLVEVNPLAQTDSGDFLAVDAKVRLDDNGLERHPELASLYDPRQEDPRETEAKKFGLSYVGLEGNIGCMVNGAGLAMATMDLIQLEGGEPANFLDVGGGASQEKVSAAFKIILQDPKVQAILVNIFGGIMRCDVVAEGIAGAVQAIGSPLPPLVVRLEGTQVKEGKEILKRSHLKIISADSLEDAARKVVSCVHSH